MMNEIEKVEMINGLLKDAATSYTGEWTETHASKMNQIFAYVNALRNETGKNYVIDGTCLIEA